MNNKDKVMEKWIYMLVIAFPLFNACTKDNFIYSGVSDGRHEGKNMLEYMETDSYNWDSTLLMIHHAGAEIVQLFEGKDAAHPEITFFGVTNHSIRRYMLENGIERVIDLDPQWCRSILLKHIVDGKFYRKDIPEGKPGSYGTVGTGGMTLKTLDGTKIWIYTEVDETSGVTENAARHIFINFTNVNKLVAVASGDIEPDNCIVHALAYGFTLGDEE